MIQIGDKSFPTRRPADIDAELIAATGCSAVEVQRQLQGVPSAGHVAKALRPFLTGDDAPSVPDLTEMVAGAGALTIAALVVALYAAVPSAAEAPDGQA